MAQNSDTQPTSQGHLAAGRDPRDFSSYTTQSNSDGERLGVRLGDEIQNLPSSKNQVIQGISGPSFRDNEFQAPAAEEPFQVPQLRIQVPEDTPSLDDNNCDRYGSQLAINRDLGVAPPGPASESDLSDLSFASIVKVNDRGTKAHMKWEQSTQNREPDQRILGYTSGLESSGVPGRSQLDTDRVIKKPNQLSPHEPLRHGTKIKMSDLGDSINIESIGNEICDSFEKSAFDGRKYLSLDRLCEILTPRVVQVLLSQHFDSSTAASLEIEVLGTPCSGINGTWSPPRRRRLFAILILIGNIKRLQEFTDLKIDDTALPLIFNKSSKGPWPEMELSYRPPDKPDIVFACWPSKTAQDFYFYQQAIHVPFFKFPGDEIFFYDLQPDSTLPFCYYEEPEIGGYASVRKAGIHHAHHDYKGKIEQCQPQNFAVKRLHVPNVDDYRNEVQIFDKLGIEKKNSMSNHLIPLLLTYRHGQDYFLMFPWADGNLKQFWRKQTANPEDVTQACWFIEQCCGISRGLRKIHHLGTLPKEILDASNASKMVLSAALEDREWGRHGDIKPENILWFEEYDGRHNHLVISDFGLTQFNSAHSRSKVLQDQIQGYSGTYRPPDLHLDNQISQRYDVWSLGCVLLEFASWFLLGYEETVNNFGEDRLRDKHEVQNRSEDKFFGLIKGTGDKNGKIEAVVKESVIAWIKKLHDTEQCTEPLHELLDLIQNTMLVPNSQDRWGCGEIRNKLQDLHHRCRKNPGFAITKARRRPNHHRDPRRWSGSSESRMPDARNEDVHLNQAVTGLSEAMVPMLPIETIKKTSTRTSQDNSSTYSPHTVPYTTQASSQQVVDQYGAQFDDIHEANSQSANTSSSLTNLRGSKMTTETTNSHVGNGNQLPIINSEPVKRQGARTSSHTSPPDPKRIIQVQRSDSRHETDGKTSKWRKVGRKILTWLREKGRR